MIVRDSKGMIIGSIDKIKGEVKELNGKSLGTIQRFNAYGEPYNFDASFKFTKVNSVLFLERMNSIFKK